MVTDLIQGSGLGRPEGRREERGRGFSDSTGQSDTRRALLDSARAHFARSGFDAASVRSITRAAGANLGAITYHFGGKEALYVEVLQEVVEPLAARLHAVVNGPGTPLERAMGVVRSFFEHFLEYPDMPPLMLQQLVTGRPPPSPVLRTMAATIQSLAGLIAEGQADGDIRQGDPLMVALSLVSQPVYMTLVSPLMSHVAGRSLTDPSTRAALVDHAVEFARVALAADPAAGEPE